MSKPSDDQLRRAHEPFTRDHDRLRNELMASLPTQAPQQTTIGWVSRGRRLIGETKMRRRLLGTTALAASVILIVFSFWPGDHNGGRAYAISDIPKLLETTKTIHIKGRGAVTLCPAPPEDKKWYPIEIWLDLENGFGRALTAGYGYDGSNKEPESKWQIWPTETISDGEYRMNVDHTKNNVTFEKISPFELLLIARRNAEGLFSLMFGNPYELYGFTKIGQEHIGDVAYDIWEGINNSADGKTGMKTKCWLCAKTGELGRIYIWSGIQKSSAPDESGEYKWTPMYQYDLIERNITLPADIFDTQPPTDYQLTNTKADAIVKELNEEGGARSGNLELQVRIAFTLEDGSVIMAWQGIDHDETESPADLFNNLAMGGSLPKLPVEAYSLQSFGSGQDITYEGYHLAYTEKNGKLIEWSLYVPDGEPPARVTFPYYRVLHRCNPQDRMGKGCISVGFHNDIVVGKSDFDPFVRGAMAELSDDGQAPEYVTYEQVMQLSKKLWESLAAKTPDPRD